MANNARISAENETGNTAAVTAAVIVALVARVVVAVRASVPRQRRRRRRRRRRQPIRPYALRVSMTGRSKPQRRRHDRDTETASIFTLTSPSYPSVHSQPVVLLRSRWLIPITRRVRDGLRVRF
jgi:hypothetical protein